MCYEHVLAYGLRLECEALREPYARITVTCGARSEGNGPGAPALPTIQEPEGSI